MEEINVLLKEIKKIPTHFPEIFQKADCDEWRWYLNLGPSSFASSITRNSSELTFISPQIKGNRS